MSKSRIISKLIIPIALLTIYSITLYRTATTPVESTSAEEQLVQTTANQESLAVNEANTSDIPRPPQAPPASDAISILPEKLRFVVLTDPSMVPAAQAIWLQPEDVILGIVHDGEAQAFPIKQMAFHHVVNIQVADESFIVTYCSLCGGYARGFKSSVDDLRYTFDIFRIYEDSLALIDRQAGSVWNQLDGKVLSGPLALQKVSLQPHILTRATWEDWQGLYPDSKVLPQYPDYLEQYSLITLTEDASGIQASAPFYEDTRLPADKLVLGVNVSNLYRAYLLDDKDHSLSVINDNLNGIPIAIFFDHNKDIAAVFQATVGDQILSFSVEGNKITDNTGGKWSFSGRGTRGQLQPVASIITQWFSWSAYHPQTSIYGQ